MAEAKQKQANESPRKSTSAKAARVLARLDHDGKTYLPNELIEAPASVIDPLEKQGRVDSGKGAVAYAKRQEEARIARDKAREA